ncbi:MAG: hypothetical protein PHN91_03285 [Patescibacteria group bacterium]|nr:hypothetical protein [Patescibacteria group bacterium]
MPKESLSAKKKVNAKTSKATAKKAPTSKKTLTKKTAAPKKKAPKKTTTSKKTATKRTNLTKKGPTKKTSVKKTLEKKVSKVKPVFVDVISDQETEATFRRPVYQPDYQEENEEEEGVENIYNKQADIPDFELTDNEVFDKQKNFFSELIEESDDFSSNEEMAEQPILRKKPLKLYRRQAWVYLAATLILMLTVFYFFAVKLTVTIHPRGEELINDEVNFTVTSATEVDSDYPLVRGEAKIVEEEAEKVYQVEKGNEVDDLSGRVRGSVTLINKLARNQRLVATTRLLTADGRLYRLDEAVNIPAGGQIETSVYADELGRDKLLTSSEKLTIPGLWEGLQNSVYAESSGPFSYQADIKTIVTEEDLEKAEADIQAVLDAKAKNDFRPAAGQATTYKEVPESFVVEFSVKAGDNASEFTATAKKGYVLARFSKEDAINLAKNRLAMVIPDDKRLTGFNPDSIVFTLEKYQSNPAQATVTANFSGQMLANGDSLFLDSNKLVSLKEAQIRDHLSQLPEIDSYELDFWPSFIKRAPHLPDRIKIKTAD